MDLFGIQTQPVDCAGIDKLLPTGFTKQQNNAMATSKAIPSPSSMRMGSRLKQEKLMAQTARISKADLDTTPIVTAAVKRV
jgi:hypothetical protein